VAAERAWQREFDDPIPVPKGKPLITLKDAATYIQKLPKAEQQRAHWQLPAGVEPPQPVSRLSSFPRKSCLGFPSLRS
jgi:hypothetical protein